MLATTADPDVRTCGVCLNHVYRSESEREIVEHASQGHCVAVPVYELPCDEDYTIGFMGAIE